MLEIIPAILPKSFEDLKTSLERVLNLTGSVQIDIVDGKYAGKPTWPFVGDNGEFKAMQREELGFPFWEEFDFEIDLMCEDPFSYVKDWITAGAQRIVFHVETLDFDNDRLALEQLRSEGLIEIGMAISIDTENEKLDELIPYADFIQIMGINEVGFQKKPFDKHCVDKVRFFRDHYPELSISVDGGMNPDTARLVIDAGANRIIAGSYIFGSSDPQESIENLKDLV
ncbi:MAG: hypothetical protein WCV55_01030 [Candidatus Paceibacterota bacterium]